MLSIDCGLLAVVIRFLFAGKPPYREADVAMVLETLAEDVVALALGFQSLKPKVGPSGHFQLGFGEKKISIFKEIKIDDFNLLRCNFRELRLLASIFSFTTLGI